MSFITSMHATDQADNTKRPDLDNAPRVESLITQLEARSMVSVPYGYGQVPIAPPSTSNRARIVASLVAIWLSNLVRAVAYLRYQNQCRLITERAPAVAPLVIPKLSFHHQSVSINFNRPSVTSCNGFGGWVKDLEFFNEIEYNIPPTLDGHLVMDTTACTTCTRFKPG